MLLEKKYNKLFETNKTIKGIEVEINLKPITQIVQQKARPIPIDLQDSIGKELKRLIELSHSEKTTDLKKRFIYITGINCDKERQIDTNSTRLEETKRRMHKKTSPNAKYGRNIQQNFTNNISENRS